MFFLDGKWHCLISLTALLVPRKLIPSNSQMSWPLAEPVCCHFGTPFFIYFRPYSTSFTSATECICLMVSHQNILFNVNNWTPWLLFWGSTGLVAKQLLFLFWNHSGYWCLRHTCTLPTAYKNNLVPLRTLQNMCSVPQSICALNWTSNTRGALEVIGWERSGSKQCSHLATFLLNATLFCSYSGKACACGRHRQEQKRGRVRMEVRKCGENNVKRKWWWHLPLWEEYAVKSDKRVCLFEVRGVE